MIAGVMPAPRDVRSRGCVGSNSITLAVAATSTLTATPDAFVSECMPRPLLTTARGYAVGGRSPRPGQHQHFLPEFLIQTFQVSRTAPPRLASCRNIVLGLVMAYLLIVSL
jgi:hypothetical protein